MVLPKEKRVGLLCFNYLPMLLGYMPIRSEEAAIKQEVVAIGGKRNASCCFLAQSFTNKVLRSADSHVHKSVLQIPRVKISNEVLDTLEQVT